MIYPVNAINLDNWSQLLIPDSDEQKTYIYQVKSSADFSFAETIYSAGEYYLRCSNQEIVGLNRTIKINKLSFSDIVYLSDLFSLILTKLVVAQSEVDQKIQDESIGEYLYSLTFPSLIQSLEYRREKVKICYFSGWKGVIRQIFSLIANFFKKYNLYIHTGIYWPGNTYVYAGKVIQIYSQLKKTPFLQQTYLQALQKCSEHLTDILEISISDLEEKDAKEIQDLIKKKRLETHPDKALYLSPDELLDRQHTFIQINKIWKNFEMLSALYPYFTDEESVEFPIEMEDLDLSKALPITHLSVPLLTWPTT